MLKTKLFSARRLAYVLSRLTPRRNLYTLYALGAACVLLSGCETPYQGMGLTGGFSDATLAPDVFRISFSGNGYTSEERVQDLAMLRASELVLIHGYTHFAILKEKNEVRVESFTTSGYASTSTHGSGYVSGNYVYVNLESTTTYHPGRTFTFFKPRTGLTVQGFAKSRLPDHFAFFSAVLACYNSCDYIAPYGS